MILQPKYTLKCHLFHSIQTDIGTFLARLHESSDLEEPIWDTIKLNISDNNHNTDLFALAYYYYYYHRHSIVSGIRFPPLSHANIDSSEYGNLTITETSPKKLCRSVTDGSADPLGCE